MKEIPFVKYTLCGNKFVIVDETVQPILTETEKSRFAYQATDMYYGVGSDNFLVIQSCTKKVLNEINAVHHYWNKLPSLKNSDYIFRMFEPDGKEAFSCGNGLLCIANYLYREYGIESARFMTEIPTAAPRILMVGTDLQKQLNWSNMGIPRQIPSDMIGTSIATPYDDKIQAIKNIGINLANNRLIGIKEDILLELSGFLVFTGEPYFVIFIESGFSSKELADRILKPLRRQVSSDKIRGGKTDYSSWIVHEIGTVLNQRYADAFPIGLNICFMRVTDKTTGVIEYRCFERGINRETWASGTGAVAASFVSRHLDKLDTNTMIIHPYLSRLRAPNSQLLVKEKEKEYFLYGSPLFLFKGFAPFGKNGNIICHVSDTEEKGNAQVFAESSETDYFSNGDSVFLYGDVASLGDNIFYHFPVPVWIPKERLAEEPPKELEPEIVHKPVPLTLLSKLKLITSALILLILVLGFNAALSLSSLKKLYVEEIVSQYQRVGKDLQQYFEASLHSGKSFVPRSEYGEDIAETNKILEDAKKRITEEFAPHNSVSVSVAMPADRSIRYSTDRNLVNTQLPGQVKTDYKDTDSKKNSDYYVKYENTYITTLPVRDKEQVWRATLVIGFGEKEIKELHDRVFHQNVRIIGIIIILGAILLIIFNLIILKVAHIQKFPRKQLSIAIFLVIVLSQIFFSGLNIYDFRNHYLQNNKEQAEVTNVNIPKGDVSAQLNEMILDALTILVISVFFFVEMLILFFQLLEKQFSETDQTNRVSPVHYGVIRPAIFLYFFSVDLCISFLPLYMEKLYEPLSGLSKDMVMGLPISVRTFFVGISFFIAGSWIDRRGWHEPFYTGLFLSGIGFLYCWLAPNALHFIIACGIVGFGYGLHLMASQGFVISYTDEESKARGFAQFYSGIYAGMLCGGVAGAMLAERIGYNSIFLVTTVILFSVIAYTSLSMRNAIRKPRYQPDEPPLTYINIKQIFSFLFNRNILLVFVCSSLFVNMTMTGFIEYSNPVYLNRIGTSQSNIGRIFMLYSFCIVYIGPFICKYVDASKNKKMYIFINGIIGSSGCIAFYLLDGIVASIVAVMMLGISQSFVFVAQNVYMFRFKITQELGRNQAIAVFRSLSRIGQVVGPIIFGWLIIAMGTNRGIACFGIAYLIISFFLLFARREEG